MLLRLALLAVLLLPAPALACSVLDSYRVPTNLELAGRAELIMLGRVTGQAQSGGNPLDRAITVVPVAAIKGALPDGHIVLGEMALTEGEFQRYGVLSNPYELEAAHPASYIGACIRYFFPRETIALFFLERSEDGKAWQPSGGPFSRWAEDVLSEDAPWLRLTRLYVRAAAAPEAERKALLEHERAQLAGRAGDIVAQLMAADIARQLAGPNEGWNEQMRRAIEDGGDIPAGAEEEAAAEALAGALLHAGTITSCDDVPDDSETVCAEVAVEVAAEEDGQADAMVELPDSN